MRALDLFCGAGGASMGLHRAGFEVVGVDINPQPNYPEPFEYNQIDALEYLDRLIKTAYIAEYDLIWASPPCQKFSAYRRKGYGVGDDYPDLIRAVRDRLIRSNIPYVIENVPGAPLHDPITLCGSMFDLDVRRHRLFECSFPVDPPLCNHKAQEAKGKRYPGATNRDGRYTCEVGVWRIPLEEQQRAMGIDWMTVKELSQAIPPAYAEFIARAFLKQKGEIS
jgi:DNA (cytosine-5)-methyltransferase 1